MCLSKNPKGDKQSFKYSAAGARSRHLLSAPYASRVATTTKREQRLTRKPTLNEAQKGVTVTAATQPSDEGFTIMEVRWPP